MTAPDLARALEAAADTAMELDGISPNDLDAKTYRPNVAAVIAAFLNARAETLPPTMWSFVTPEWLRECAAAVARAAEERT